MLIASIISVPISQMRKQTRKCYITGRVTLGQEVAGLCESEVHVLFMGPPASLDCHDNLVMQRPCLCCSFLRMGKLRLKEFKKLKVIRLVKW